MSALAEATELLEGTLCRMMGPSTAPAFVVGTDPLSDLGLSELLNG